MAAWLRPLILMIFSGQLTALPETIKIGKFTYLNINKYIF